MPAPEMEETKLNCVYFPCEVPWFEADPLTLVYVVVQSYLSSNSHQNVDQDGQDAAQVPLSIKHTCCTVVSIRSWLDQDKAMD